MISLQIKNICPDLKDFTKRYTSEEVKTEMLNEINQTLEEKWTLTLILLNLLNYSDVTIH